MCLRMCSHGLQPPQMRGVRNIAIAAQPTRARAHDHRRAIGAHVQHWAIGTSTEVHPEPRRAVLMDHLFWWLVPLSSLVSWHSIRVATLFLVIPRRSSPTPRSLSVRVARRKGVLCAFHVEGEVLA